MSDEDNEIDLSSGADAAEMESRAEVARQRIESLSRPKPGPCTITEVEPDLFEMRFQHGGHEHGMRAMSTAKGGAFVRLTDCYTMTVRLIREGRLDLAGCPETP